MLALDWLAKHTAAALTVVVPCTLADQPEQARHTVLSAAGRTQRVSLVELGAPRLGVDAYHARNRWMVDRSDLVIGFPHGDNRAQRDLVHHPLWSRTSHTPADRPDLTPKMNDRASACRLLRRLREQRGWSWADQARALRAVAERLSVAAGSTQLTSLQRSIARWESPQSRTVPGERYQLLLAHLCARSGSGELILGTSSDLDILLTALSHFGVTAARIDELRDLMVRSTSVDDGQLLALLADPTRRGVLEALRDPRRLDAELVDQLSAAMSDVDRQIGNVPFVRLQLLLAPVVEMCRRLRHTEAQ